MSYHESYHLFINFFYYVQQDHRTFSLRKIPGRVSTINIDFLGQQFDLILVVLPSKTFAELNSKYNIIYEFDINLSVEKVDEVIANFIEAVGGHLTFYEKSAHFGMLLALSGQLIFN